MRPTSLTLEGFGSYATSTVIPLSDISLAAITGQNGAGKSTIWDAIIYALYGTTRASGRDSDSVVSLGFDQCTVAYEFDLDGALWRATRTRQRGKRTTALLEVYDDESLSGWTARSDGSVRNTDRAIVELLGMSADTFLATVMVGQGDADRFTSSDPAQRKHVLHEVLGLDVFSLWNKRAKEHLDEVRSDLSGLRGKAEPLMERVSDLEDVETAVADAEDKAAAAENAASRAESRRSEAENRLSALDNDIAALERARQKLDALTSEARERAAEAERSRKEAERAKSLAEQGLRDAAAALEKSRSAESKVDDLRGRASEVQAKAEQVQVERDEMVERGQTRKIDLTQVEAQRDSIVSTVSEKTEQLEGLTKAAESGDPTCWVCEQALPPERAQEMVASLTEEIADLRREKADKEREVETVSVEVQELRDKFNALRSEAASLVQSAEDARASVEAAAAEARLVDERSARVDEAQRALDGAVQGIKASSEPVEDPQVKVVGDEVAEIEGRVSDAGALRAAVDESARAADEARRVHARALEDKGRLAERLAEIGRAADALTEVDAAIVSSEKEEGEWANMVKAFSKDGVPALVVASVVPELEAQANEVLSLLSNGTLMVRLATEKQTKSGTTKDTLEVAVLSAEGERPYETFSGGESLRVDLALRIGLSRLLAHRSGTQMRTLVIDEGWGALDTDGVSALSECLRTLHESGEFGAVFTVTHIPEIASAFPQQLIVSRDDEGYSMTEVLAS